LIFLEAEVFYENDATNGLSYSKMKANRNRI